MVLWLTLLFGIISQCDAVTYQLSAVPEKVAIGQTLTITAKLLNPTSANTDLRIQLTQPGMQTIALFQYRTATGCIFLPLEPYISTGTVVACEPANSRYVIRFQSVSYAHVGRYETSAPQEIPSRSTYEGVSTDVQLLISTTRVTIAPSRREVIEDQATNFVCTVDDQATTPVSFVWRRIVNGNRVNPPAVALTTMISGGRSNRLSWNSISRQHAGHYECKASNEVGQLTSQPTTLVVYYAATSVYLTLSTGTSTVSVGTSVTFTCMSTGGNPRPGLVIADAASGRVLKESVQSGSSVLTYGPISMQKSANGAKYRCKTKATVSAGIVPVRGSNILTLNVQYPPDDISLSPPTVTVDEGRSTTVRCETTTSSNPRTELTWTGPSVGHGPWSEFLGSHGGTNSIRTITLTGDRTRNGATYTCTATHLGQQIYTLTTKVDVNFAPKAIAFYDTSDTPILENQERVMRCRAESSKPAGTIVWRKIMTGSQFVIPADPPTKVPGDFGGTVVETEITIQPSRRDNEAKYWCEVYYTYTNGTKVTRRPNAKIVEVYYPTDVGITVSQGTDNIREGDPITLTCATSGGNPQTIDKYSWSHNENILVDESKRTLSLNPVQYDQGGRYSCSATNKGGTSTSSIYIDVKYTPRLDPAVVHRFELGARVGGSVTFSLTILANPAPTSVQWTATDGGHYLSQRFIQTTDGNVYSLRVNDITVGDFTTYICRVDNSVGSTHFLVTLQSRGPPETPSNFVALARSKDTITLLWTSDFSGAYSQTFLLEQIEPERGVNQFEEMADPGIGSNVTHIAKNLEPATRYTFRLRSRNNLGLFSQYTETTESTKPGLYASSLDVRIVYVDQTTVSGTWKTDEELIRNYRNAIVRIQYTPVRFRFRRASTQRTEDTERMGSGSFTTMFLHGSALFNTSRGVQEYSFDVIVIDNDGNVVLSLSNLKADRKNAADVPSFAMPLIITLSVLGLVVLISVSIVVAICCRIRKLKSRLKTAQKSPDPSVKSPVAEMQSAATFDNAAFEEENPYMIPQDADPAYYHYSGNKYAVAGKPAVNDVTDNDYDVIRAQGEGDYATIGDDRDKYDAMDDEAGYVDMSGINNNQDEKSVPENEYIEIDNRRNKKGAPENEYMEMKINDRQSKKSVPEDEYVEMHSPVGCKMPK